jgi:hypothetical protein
MDADVLHGDFEPADPSLAEPQRAPH